MKFEFNKRYNTIALYAFLVLAAAALFSGFLGNLKYFERQIELVVGLLTPFIYGFAIAYLLNPVLKFFEHDCLDRLLGDRINDQMSTKGTKHTACTLFSCSAPPPPSVLTISP